MSFQITDLMLHIPQFLSEEECQSLINEYEKKSKEGGRETSTNACTGVNEFSTYERIFVPSGSPNYGILFRKNQELINKYLDHLKAFKAFHMPLLKKAFLYSHEYRILRYEQGQSIHPHSDHAIFGYGSATFNLNDSYEGGEFSFFNDQYRIELGKGDALIWPADYYWVHEVLPVRRGIRYSVNSFLLSEPGDFRNYMQSNLGEIKAHWSRFVPHGAPPIGPYSVDE